MNIYQFHISEIHRKSSISKQNAEKISPNQQDTSHDKIEKFIELNVTNAIQSDCSEMHVEIIRIFFDKLSDKEQEKFINNLVKSTDEAIKKLIQKQVCGDSTIEKQAEAIGVFLGHLYKNVLMKSHIINKFLLNKSAAKLFCVKTVRRWILLTIKDEIKKNVDQNDYVDSITSEIFMILMLEKFIDDVPYQKYSFVYYETKNPSAEVKGIVLKGEGIIEIVSREKNGGKFLENMKGFLDKSNLTNSTKTHANSM